MEPELLPLQRLRRPQVRQHTDSNFRLRLDAIHSSATIVNSASMRHFENTKIQPAGQTDQEHQVPVSPPSAATKQANLFCCTYTYIYTAHDARSPTFYYLPFRNHLGPHSDTLSSIGPEAIVVGVSLGAKRVFVVQEKLPWGVKAPVGSGLEGKKKVTVIHFKEKGVRGAMPLLLLLCVCLPRMRPVWLLRRSSVSWCICST